MSDARLRELERTAAENPSDVEARLRLEDERVRLGLGWSGQALPRRGEWFLTTAHERGVYRWVSERAHGRPFTTVGMEMVFVPRGDVPCSRCNGSGNEPRPEPVVMASFDGPGFSKFEYAGPDVPCLEVAGGCKGTGKKTVGGFYLGRFPVLLGEFAASFGMKENAVRVPGTAARHPLQWMIREEAELEPSVHVQYHDALTFCARTMTRVATPEEWRWSARAACPRRGISGLVCPRCQGYGSYASRYPWGEDEPNESRAVTAFSSAIVWNSVRAIFAATRIPCPVKAPGRLNPAALVSARPAGASWCGALDLWHVYEWVAGGGIIGGSFRSSDWSSRPILSNITSTPLLDEVGFRVVLDAES